MKITLRAGRCLGAAITVVAPVLFAASSASASPNEVLNYNFTLGNEDFTSQYTYVTAPTVGDTTVPGDYGVGTKPTQFNSMWDNVTPPKDYSGGSTNFLIADGSPKTTAQYVWQESLSVVKGDTYSLGAWIVNLDKSSLKTGELYFGINGTEVSPVVTLPSSSNAWQDMTGTYTATATGKVNFAVYDASNVHQGNDFGLDDLSFKVAAVPEASTMVTFTLLCAGGLMLLRKRTGDVC